MRKSITIVVCDQLQSKFGIEVDEIGDVIAFHKSALMPRHLHYLHHGVRYIKGFFQADEHLHIYLNLMSLT